MTEAAGARVRDGPAGTRRAVQKTPPPANCDASAVSVDTVPPHTPQMRSERAKICQRDYESFTDSWLAADMNPGGRIPRVWASCADHEHGTPRDERLPPMPPVNRARQPGSARAALRPRRRRIDGRRARRPAGHPGARRGNRQRRPAGRGRRGRLGADRNRRIPDDQHLHRNDHQPETPTTPTTTTPAATTPSATTTPTTTTPASTTPQASAPAPAATAAPTVVLKRKQKATPSTPANPSQTQTGPERDRKREVAQAQPKGIRPEQRRGLAAVGRGRGRRARGGARLLRSLRPGARLLPHPAVPAADLQGGRGAVRRAVADPRGDQRNRDRLRHRPVGLHRRRGRLDAVHAQHLAAVRRRRARTPATRTPTTRSTRSSPPRATCARPAPRPTCAPRSSPTTTPKNMSNRCCCGRS